MTKIKVAISISEPDNLRELGMGTMHLQDALVETARQVLRKGYSLAYGGNLNYQGEYNFSELLNLIARNYSREKCIYHYVAYPMQMLITAKQRDDLEGIGEIIPVVPGGISSSLVNRSYETASEYQKKQIDAELYGEEFELTRSQGLTAMRDRMARDTPVRIIIGGKVPKSGNKIPGIMEEALLSLSNKSSVIVDGRFGGAARLIVNAIAGKDFDNPHSSILSDISKNSEKFDLIGDVLFIHGKQNLNDFRNISSWT